MQDPMSEMPRRLVGGTPAFRRLNLALFAAGFSTFAILYCVQPLLPVFSREFHVSAAVSSLSLSLTTGFLAVAMLVAGSLSEVWGRKPVMVASLLSSAVLTILSAAGAQLDHPADGPHADRHHLERTAGRGHGLCERGGGSEIDRPCHGALHRRQRGRRHGRTHHRRRADGSRARGACHRGHRGLGLASALPPGAACRPRPISSPRRADPVDLLRSFGRASAGSGSALPVRRGLPAHGRLRDALQLSRLPPDAHRPIP